MTKIAFPSGQIIDFSGLSENELNDAVSDLEQNSPELFEKPISEPQEPKVTDLDDYSLDRRKIEPKQLLQPRKTESQVRAVIPSHIGEIENAFAQGYIERGFDIEDKKRRTISLFGDNSFAQDDKGNIVLNLDNIDKNVKEKYNLPDKGSIYVNQPGFTKYDVSNFFATEAAPLVASIGAGLATTGAGALIGIPAVALSAGLGRAFDEVVIRSLEEQQLQKPENIMKAVALETFLVGAADTALRGIATGARVLGKGRGAEPDADLVEAIKSNLMQTEKLSEAEALKKAVPIAREAQALSMREMIDSGAKIPIETLSGKAILGRTQSILESIFPPNSLSIKNKAYIEKQVANVKSGVLDKDEALERINEVIDPIIKKIAIKLNTDDGIKIARKQMKDILEPQLVQLQKAYEVDPNLSAKPFLEAIDNSLKLFNMHSTNLYKIAKNEFSKANDDALIDITPIKKLLERKGLGPASSPKTTSQKLSATQYDAVSNENEIIKLLNQTDLTSISIEEIPVVKNALRSLIADPIYRNSASDNLVGNMVKLLDDGIETKKIKAIEQNKQGLKKAINSLENAQDFYKDNIDMINSGINNAVRKQIEQGFTADGKLLVDLFVNKGQPNKLKSFLNSVVPSAQVQGILANIRKTGDDVLERAAKEFDKGTTQGIKEAEKILQKTGLLDGAKSGKFKYSPQQNFLKFPTEYKNLSDDINEVGGQLKKRAMQDYAKTLRLYDSLSKNNIAAVSFKENIRKKLAGEWIDTNKGDNLKQLSNAFNDLGEATAKQLFGKDYSKVKSLMDDFGIDDFSSSGKSLQSAAIDGIATSSKELDDVLKTLEQTQLKKLNDSKDTFLKAMQGRSIENTDQLVNYILNKNNPSAYRSFKKEILDLNKGPTKNATQDLNNFKTAVVQRLLPVSIKGSDNTIGDAILSGQLGKELLQNIQKDKKKLVEILGQKEVDQLLKLSKEAEIVSNAVLKGKQGLAAAAFSAGFLVSVIASPVATLTGAAGMLALSKLLRNSTVMKVFTSKRLRGKAAERAQGIVPVRKGTKKEVAKELAEERLIEDALLIIRQTAIQAQQSAVGSGVDRVIAESKPLREDIENEIEESSPEIQKILRNLNQEAENNLLNQENNLKLPDTNPQASMLQAPRTMAPNLTASEVLASVERDKLLGIT